MDIRQLRANIRDFSLEDGDLGSQGYDRVLLQLFGYTGHGKSSFVNSCKYVLEDGEKFFEYAEAGETDHGLTMIRHPYELTERITVVDNRGCSKLNDFERAEVYAQLGNFIRPGQKVEWKDNFSDMMEDLENSELQPSYADFIVPIFVYSVAQGIHNAEMEEVKKFMENCVRMTGIVPIIVLTFKTKGDYMETEKRFRLMGAEMVIAIENYTKTSHIKTLGRTVDILMVIDSALKNVQFRLEQPRNPRRERVERKKFLLNYIHQTTAIHEWEKRGEFGRERGERRMMDIADKRMRERAEIRMRERERERARETTAERMRELLLAMHSTSEKKDSCVVL